MDPDTDTEATQQATQNVLDPRRIGQQNSGFSDEDLSDIICLLSPVSELARSEVSRVAVECSDHLVARADPDAVRLDLYQAGDATRLGPLPHVVGEYDIALRLSARVKDPVQGFTFGRNPSRCDIWFVNDPLRRLSNVHFRIYFNEYGVLMLEDQSTNGTIVDEKLLKARSTNSTDLRRTLGSGSTIKILMHKDPKDLIFFVRIPRREGKYEAAYERNFKSYMHRQRRLIDAANATIGPGPGGHVNLFPPQFQQPQRPAAPKFALPEDTTQENAERVHKPFTGSEDYHRVGEIGKGAFATVYKVTNKYNGFPFAAKELDKRKFMKNGVLDQKVENEMMIMQQVQHPNIVRYVEHIDWDERLLIIIMEYVAGGDLGRLITERGPLTESAVKTMAGQLLEALGHLHGKSITHRDVKPDNILISSQDPFVVKLTDFGLSKMVDGDQTFLRTFCGTLLYCAPEVYSEYAEYDENGRRNLRNKNRKQVQGRRYDHAVDIWSLGGVLFYALTGSVPFPVKTPGSSYSELLHHIMTQPLDVSPLRKANVSIQGIDFIKRMLDRRPETRATILYLQNHAWLGGMGRRPRPTQSYDEISDEELGQSASQLSLDDRHAPQGVAGQIAVDDEEVMEENDENRYGGYDSEKENYTFGPGNHPQRLFGEVNISAIGNEGVIPANRLNLPISETSFGTTEILEGSEVRDGPESDASSTPRQKSQKSQPNSGGRLRLSAGSANQSRSVNQLNNMTFDEESQDLGGAESILENLNMRSMGGSHLQSHVNDYFTTSKRKPSQDDSEESGTSSAVHDRPTAKRLKSDGLADSMTDYSSDEGENELFAHIPPMPRTQSTRQIDDPVDKSTFWSAKDKKTWHLKYPEMTQIQLDALRSAAAARGEEFAPGKSRIWDLAMKHFPPLHYEAVLAQSALGVESASNDGKAPLRRDDGTLEELAGSEVPPTAGATPNDQALQSIPSIPATQAKRIVPFNANPTGKRIVASLHSTPSSVLQDISIHVTDSIISWGRAIQNTRCFGLVSEARVPKFAFRIMLWREGFQPAKDLRPWNKKQPETAPDDDPFYFYISSKATNGIHVNNIHIPSHDPRNADSPARYWLRLHHGDAITVWHDGFGTPRSYAKQPVPPPLPQKTELRFECHWGGSAKPRPQQVQPLELAALESEPVARILDELCHPAHKKLYQKKEREMQMEEAHIDAEERRLLNFDAEKERSRMFELKRQKACRDMARRNSSARASRRVSPAAAQTPARGRYSPGLPAGLAPGHGQGTRVAVGKTKRPSSGGDSR